jgi:hypothetical protein
LATVHTEISYFRPSLRQSRKTDLGQASASIKIFIESKHPPYYQEKSKGVCKNLYNKKGQHQMVPPLFLNPPLPPLIKRRCEKIGELRKQIVI